MFKLFGCFIFTICSLNVFAQQSDKLNLDIGETAMQISLQKELMDILINDSNEVQEQYRQKNIFYKNDDLLKYQFILADICSIENVQVCPEVYFSKREYSGPSAMYPNGVLAINKKFINRVSLDEATFILAHEFAHYKLQHARQRVKVIAKIVVDNAIQIREPEQALGAVGFFPELRQAHKTYEDEADRYGYSYIKLKGITLDCVQMYENILMGAPEINEKHNSVKERCDAYQNTL